MSLSFSGGIAFSHDMEHKAATASLPIEQFHPTRVVIPLRQGLAPPCVPTVDIGQSVKIGQLIGQPPDGRGPRIHTGVAGTVTAIAPHPVIEGEEVLSVTIQSDQSGRRESPLPHQDDTPAGRVALMDQAGLIGMGGAGFPTARKFSAILSPDVSIHQILINGCECEPFLTCDHRLMLQMADQVIRGAEEMSRIAGVPVTLCVEANKPDAIAALQTAARNSGVTVLTLQDRYPQGGERQLIQAVWGQEVPAGKLPADIGVLVSNVATTAAFGDALDGKPLTHRIITVSGQVSRPANLLAPVGTLLSDMLGYTGGCIESDGAVRQFLAGGPMTGRWLDNLEVPMTKTTGGFLVLPSVRDPEQPCIRCGACARVCPSRLMPFAIDRAVIAGDRSTCADYQAQQCIACGSCSFVCPAKRFLAARVSLVRNTLRRQS